MELTGIAREDFAAKDLICENEIKLTSNFKECNGIPDAYSEGIEDAYLHPLQLKIA